MQEALQGAEQYIGVVDIGRPAAGIEVALDPAVDGRVRSIEQSGRVGDPQVAFLKDSLQPHGKRLGEDQDHLNTASRSRPGGDAGGFCTMPNWA